MIELRPTPPSADPPATPIDGGDTDGRAFGEMLAVSLATEAIGSPDEEGDGEAGGDESRAAGRDGETSPAVPLPVEALPLLPVVEVAIPMAQVAEADHPVASGGVDINLTNDAPDSTAAQPARGGSSLVGPAAPPVIAQPIGGDAGGIPDAAAAGAEVELRPVAPETGEPGSVAPVLSETDVGSRKEDLARQIMVHRLSSPLSAARQLVGTQPEATGQASPSVEAATLEGAAPVERGSSSQTGASLPVREVPTTPLISALNADFKETSMQTARLRGPQPVQGTALAERVIRVLDVQRLQPPPRSVVVDIPEVDGLRLLVSLRSGGRVHLASVGSNAAPQALAPFMAELDRVLSERGFVLSDHPQRGKREGATESDNREDTGGTPQRQRRPGPRFGRIPI